MQTGGLQKGGIRIVVELALWGSSSCKGILPRSVHKTCSKWNDGCLPWGLDKMLHSLIVVSHLWGEIIINCNCSSSKREMQFHKINLIRVIYVKCKMCQNFTLHISPLSTGDLILQMASKPI